MGTIRIQHQSMQFSDPNSEHARDAKAVFDRAVEREVWAVTGTEAGGGNNDDLRLSLISEAQKHNFYINAHRAGEWVALNRRMLKSFDHGFEGPFIPAKGGSASEGAHGPRGIAWAQGLAKDGSGRVTVGSTHWLTKRSMVASHTDNKPMVKGAQDYGMKYGKGGKLVFLCGDANERDDIRDLFQGGDFLTIGDELKKHPKTHGKDTAHGTVIDFIASWKKDTRVSAKAYQVYDDRTVKLFTDHFLLEATFTVAAKPKKKP